jgi:hypothetical protein
MYLDETHPFNVLVLGCSQQGKSTFVQKLRDVAEVKSAHTPDIGGGASRCTCTVDVYPLSLSTTTYKLVDKNGEEVEAARDERAIFEELAFRRDIAVAPVDPDAPRMQLRLIDTPGLDDSEGDDAENIRKVLEALVQNAKSEDPSMRYISAILMVVKTDSAFSDSFQTIYAYYRKCMPNLFRGAAIVNTNFTLTFWEQQHEKQTSHLSSMGSTKSAKMKYMQIRHDDFHKELKDHRRHFFLDSKPDKRYPFEEYSSLNSIADILNFISAQGSMPITEMTLHKFDAWFSIDATLVGYLHSARNHFQDRRDRILAASSNAVKTRAMFVKNQTMWESQLTEINDELQRKDTDTEYGLETKSTQPPSYSEYALALLTGSGVEDVVMLEGKLDGKPISEFWVKALDSDRSHWIRKDMDKVKKIWTGRYRANYGGYEPLSARSYTTNRVVYAERIRELKDKRDKVLEELKETKYLIESQGSHESPAEREIELQRLDRWMIRCEEIIKKLESPDVPLADALNKSALRRYKRKDASYVKPVDLYRLVRPTDGHLEGALKLIEEIFASGIQKDGALSEPSDDEFEVEDASVQKDKTEEEAPKVDQKDKTEEEAPKVDVKAKPKPNPKPEVGSGMMGQAVSEKLTAKKPAMPMEEKPSHVAATRPIDERPHDSEKGGKESSKCCVVL